MRLKVTCSALSVNANIYPALYLRFHFFYIFLAKKFFRSIVCAYSAPRSTRAKNLNETLRLNCAFLFF